MSPFMVDVCDVLDAVNAGGKTGMKAGMDASRNASGGKRVEAIFGGHCHIDYDGRTGGEIRCARIGRGSSRTITC